MVMVKRFDKDHHFSNFHILVTILFFKIKSNPNICTFMYFKI